MGSFLEQFNDPGIEVDMGWTPNAETHRQYKRAMSTAAMASAAMEVPRRISGATPPQLAADKALSRKIAARSGQFASQWQNDGDFDDFLEASESERLKIEGAQVVWLEWWPGYKTHLRSELRRIATHALRTGHAKTGNRFCNRIVNELAQLQQLIDNYNAE